jgi:hypothetical protein
LHDATTGLPEVLLVPGELDPLGPTSPYDEGWIALRGLPGWGGGVRVVPDLTAASERLGVELGALVEGRTGWPRLAVVTPEGTRWEPLPASIEAGLQAPGPGAPATGGANPTLLQGVRDALHAAGEEQALALLDELVAEAAS